MRAGIALTLLVAASACGAETDRVDMIHAAMDHTPCARSIDSVALARAALDTISKRYRAQGLVVDWTVRRFEADSGAGIIRVYARPSSPPSGGDAVGIVLLNCDGAAFDVILSDTLNSPEA